MGALGLTAFVITLHVPALALSCALGVLAAAIARVVGAAAHGPRSIAVPVVWGVAVAVVVYAVVCRVVGVHAVGFEAIDLVG